MKLKFSGVESFVDERASRYFDLYPELSGQVTASHIEKFQFSGWHKHKLQYDQFFVAVGKIKIGVISPDGDITEEILSADEPRTIFIPPNYWHCYHAMDEKALLIYYLSRKHDESDELRASVEEIKEKYNYTITA